MIHAHRHDPHDRHTSLFHSACDDHILCGHGNETELDSSPDRSRNCVLFGPQFVALECNNTIGTSWQVCL